MDFIGILVAHWVGDFLLQTRQMATNKHKNPKWLGLHLLIYSLVILGAGQLLFSWQVGLGYAVFNGLLHLITDFFTSKAAHKFQNNPRIFYPIIGFDQMVHVICLYWTYINSDVLAL